MPANPPGPVLRLPSCGPRRARSASRKTAVPRRDAGQSLLEDTGIVPVICARIPLYAGPHHPPMVLRDPVPVRVHQAAAGRVPSPFLNQARSPVGVIPPASAKGLQRHFAALRPARAPQADASAAANAQVLRRLYVRPE